MSTYPDYLVLTYLPRENDGCRSEDDRSTHAYVAGAIAARRSGVADPAAAAGSRSESRRYSSAGRRVH